MRFSSIVAAGILAACAVGAASAQTSVDRTFTATSTTVLYMGGIETPIAKLYRGAKLNFYVPEDRLTAQFFADDSGTKIVEVPIVREQVAAREIVAARELPATGSSLPLVGWSAVLLILVGTAVTVHRMLRGSSPSARPKHRIRGKFPLARGIVAGRADEMEWIAGNERHARAHGVVQDRNVLRCDHTDARMISSVRSRTAPVRHNEGRWARGWRTKPAPARPPQRAVALSEVGREVKRRMFAHTAEQVATSRVTSAHITKCARRFK